MSMERCSPKRKNHGGRSLSVPPNSRHVAAIVVMVALFSATMVARNSIRAHWWTRQLSRCFDAEQRTVYVRKMQSLGSAVVGPSETLANHPDPNIRLAGVQIWRAVRDPRSAALLTVMTVDPNADVRRAAIMGLGEQRSSLPSHWDSPSALVRTRSLTVAARTFEGLRGVIGGANERDAMIAVTVVARMSSEQADSLLADALRSSRHAGVKVQIIECINEGRRLDLIEPLIDALDDTAVFAGLTEGQMLARKAFAAVRSDVGAELGGPDEWTLELETSHVVGRCAADTLHALTGH